MCGRVALQVQTALDGSVIERVRVGMCRLALGTRSECEQRALRHALGDERRDEYAALRECAVAVECDRIDVQQFGERPHAAACDGRTAQPPLDSQGNQPT